MSCSSISKFSEIAEMLSDDEFRESLRLKQTASMVYRSIISWETKLQTSS